MVRCFWVTCLLPVFLLSCKDEQLLNNASSECYNLPVGTHLPRFSSSGENLYLSYVSSSEEADTLLLTQPAREETKRASVQLAYADDWFINWADFPSVAFVDNGLHGDVLFYHYLSYSGKGTYDYDIKYGLIDENGPLFPDSKLHTDTVSAEHGFVSTASIPGGGLQLTWLDGRFTKEQGGAAGAEKGTKEKGDGHGHGGSGAMTLRTKAISDSASVELDHRVCDCCNTATVATDSLIMVAYRDRSEHEIRDISYVVKRTGSDEWSVPKSVHADNWEISGCPVNGPALAATPDGNIAIVWYTAPAGRAQILFSRYNTELDAWQSPILLDDDSPHGRVDLQAAPDGTAYATALTANDNPDRTNLTLWTIATDNSVKREVLTTTSAARSSGFPKTALHNGELFRARTVVGNGKTNHFVEVCRQRLLRP